MATAKKAASKKPAAKKAAPKKAAAKKAAPKKAAPKKAAAKKAAPKKVVAPARKVTAIKERYTKTQILAEISQNTELSKKQVSDVLEELSVLVERHIKKNSCGEFVLPGMMKISTVVKPAKKARKGINPFTGEEQMFKAKPKSTAVKVRPLKRMKDMAV